MQRIALAVFAAAALLMAGQAQAAACDGHIMIVRVSKLKPGVALAQFQEAFDAHIAWYRSHGYTQNRLTMSQVVAYDPQTNQVGPSPDLVLTVHHDDPGVQESQQDAAWAAYVAKYRAVSDIQTQTVACEPKE
jgi:hypothetical protein